VGTILTNFPDINTTSSAVELEKIKEYVMQRLPQLSKTVSIAFYTGGELTYMKLANYALEKNTLFVDNDHPFVITLKNYQIKNKELFTTITLAVLEALMPQNPAWMHGARACSAFSQAICEFYHISTIIPSDANLVNGIVRREFSI